MPQVSSVCCRPSRVFSSAPAVGDRTKDKLQKHHTRKRLKGRRKTNKANSAPVRTRVPEDEDWEREIEEEKQKEMSSETPYDGEEELKVALCEMSLYSVPSAPRLHQHHYDPSVHHTPPVTCIQHIGSAETDQFADAEE